jgi:hypothetical protein
MLFSPLNPCDLDVSFHNCSPKVLKSTIGLKSFADLCETDQRVVESEHGIRLRDAFSDGRKDQFFCDLWGGRASHTTLSDSIRVESTLALPHDQQSI